MQTLALTAVQERPAQERVSARAPDRIEILSPRRDDMRASARRYQEAANRYAEYRYTQQEEPRWSRGTRTTQNSARFLAQHMAQQQPANGAHVENWRGARTAYSRADGLAQPAGATLSILI
jgi:hypothetical protein